MARTVTIDDEDILRAAREVFLERGIRGTTAEVAARAGVSEGAIFKRWKTKERLFQAAMKGVDDVAWIARLSERSGKGELLENLVAIGLEAIAFFVQTIPLHMMSWSNRQNAASVFEPGEEPPPLVARRRVIAYFESEKRAGRLATHVDPDVLARTFIGAVYNFAAMRVMFGEDDPLPMAPEAFARGLAGILLRGIEPPVHVAPKKYPR